MSADSHISQEYHVTQTGHEQNTSEPLSQLPTRENLNKFHKADLQKRCRDLGITKVWFKKNELIDMIMNTVQQSSQTLQTSQARTQSRSSPARQLIQPDVTPMSAVTEVLNHPPSREAQPTSSDDELSPDSEATQPSYIPHTVNEASTIDPQETLIVNGSRQPPADDTQQLTTDDTHPSLPTHHHDMSDQERNQLQNIYDDIKLIKSKLEIKDSEIELLNAEVKTAYCTIHLLQQRIADLEHENKSRPQDAASDATASTECLLLGDTNTQRVLRSDLGDKCRVKTIAHANIDLLRSWVTEKLQSAPSECVILGGVYDILEELPAEIILDHLGSLISDLKEKNSEMKIHVCQVVPVPEPQEFQAKVKYYNDRLIEWGEANGVNIVKTAPEFILGTGNVDEWCFDIENRKPCTLNRMGVIKLLSALEKQCSGFHLCKNWASIQRQPNVFLNTHGDTHIGARPQLQHTLTTSIPPNAATHKPPLLPTPQHATSTSPRTQPHSYAAAVKRSPSHNVDAGWGERWMTGSADGSSGRSPELFEIDLGRHDMGSTSIHPHAPNVTHYTHHYTPYSTLDAQPHIMQHTHNAHPHRPHLGRSYTSTRDITNNTQSNTPRYTCITQPRAPQNIHHTQPRVPHYNHYAQSHTPHNAHYTQHQVSHNAHNTQLFRPHRNYNSQSHTLHSTHYTQPYTPHNTHYTRPQTLYNSHHTAYTSTRGKYSYGCYNCGEHNHRQDTCRFDHRLKCELCHRLGHKQKLCHLYTK